MQTRSGKRTRRKRTVTKRETKFEALKAGRAKQEKALPVDFVSTLFEIFSI